MNAIDPNYAPAAVLRAVPAMDEQVAGRIVSERSEKPFTNVSDLTARIPEIAGSDALMYLTFRPDSANSIVSQAKLFSSGASRTVRLLFTVVPQEDKVPEIKFGRWQLE